MPPVAPSDPLAARSAKAPASAPQVRRPSTFSLLQLFVGLGIVGLLSAVAIPAWFEQPEVTLERAAELFAEDLREAQNRAAFGHRPVEVLLFPDGDGYEVRDEAGHPPAARVGAGPFRRVYSKDAVFRGVRLQVCEGAAEGRISYDRLGFLAEPTRIEMHYRDRRIRLSLERSTGRIEIADSSSPWTDDGN
jgi:Tfp pilus assembly protein FimT